MLGEAVKRQKATVNKLDMEIDAFAKVFFHASL